MSWSSWGDVAAYGSLIQFSNGTYTSLSRRERPHLVFDEQARPVGLTNGATEHWPCTHPENCPRDHCFTAFQWLHQE